MTDSIIETSLTLIMLAALILSAKWFEREYQRWRR